MEPPHRIHPPDRSGLRARRGLPRAFTLRLGARHPAQPPNSPLIPPSLPFYLRLSVILTRVVSMTVPGAFRIASTPLSFLALLVLTILLPRGVSLSDTFAV